MTVDREKIIAEELQKKEPFEWGVRDCCTWAASVAGMICGTDYAEPLRGTYSSQGGAIRLIAKAGGLDSLITGLIGESVPAIQARRGDIVTGFVPDLAAGICAGHRVAFLQKDGSFRVMDLSRCWRAWRV